MVVDGIAEFQGLNFTFQALKFAVKSLVLLVRRRVPQKFQALRFQNSGPEIWRIHPPPFHTPPFASLYGLQGNHSVTWGAWEDKGPLSGPVHDTPPVSRNTRDSSAEGGIARVFPCFHRLGRCEMVLRFMGREVKGR